MRRIFNLLRVAAAAILALAVLTASQAQAHQFNVEKAPAVITGSQDLANIFTFGASVECNQAKYSGTVAEKTANTVTLSPAYGECTFNFSQAVFRTNHCAYVLGNETDVTSDAKFEIECASGNALEVEIPGLCTVKVGSQTPELGGVHYTSTNSGVFREVTISLTVQKIKYEKVGGIGCLFAGNGKEGKLQGAVTARAFEDLGSVQSGTEKTTPFYSEGSFVGLFMSE